MTCRHTRRIKTELDDLLCLLRLALLGLHMCHRPVVSRT
jgi:hypothetical protein